VVRLRAVIAARAGFDGDSLGRTDRLAQLAGDAAFLAIGIAAQRMFAAKARRDRVFLERIVDGRLRLEEVAHRQKRTPTRTPSGRAMGPPDSSFIGFGPSEVRSNRTQTRHCEPSQATQTRAIGAQRSESSVSHVNPTAPKRRANAGEAPALRAAMCGFASARNDGVGSGKHLAVVASAAKQSIDIEAPSLSGIGSLPGDGWLRRLASRNDGEKADQSLVLHDFQLHPPATVTPTR
jgi:hypothetical protein